MMIPTRFSPMARTSLLSWPQKARMGMEYLLPPAPLNGDETLGNFVSRRLGRAAYERLIEPLMSGIYAGDGDQLSLKATFPTLRELELKHGGLVRGALAARRSRNAASSGESCGGKVKDRQAAGSRSVFLTPRSGLAEMVEALVRFLDHAQVTLRSGTAVISLAEENEAFVARLDGGESLEADRIVLAAPAFAAGDLLASMDPALAAELRAIEYVSTATISLAYPNSALTRPLDGYGYVIPRREGRQALACTWTSTKFPHRAPQGYALVRVFAGRAGQENEIHWEDAALLELAKDELRQTLGLTSEPELWRVFRWERAMPQYNLGHPERLERIEAALERWPGLALAGAGYYGIGLPDCIRSGELAARRVLSGALQPVIATDSS
jgi:oxygen-dependent protoporphyrinogen oxidase